MATIQNLQVSDYPYSIGATQIIGIHKPTFKWVISGSPTLFNLQINYGVLDFSSPLVDVPTFFNSSTQYVLAPEYTLVKDGLYYARLRAYDGSWGAWSSVLTFEISSVLPNPPIITSVTSPATGFYQSVSGTKDPDLYVYISNNNSDWAEVTYPGGISGITWSYTVPLVSGDNTIRVISSLSHSSSGVVSQIVSSGIYLAALTPEVYNVWNCFDEFGLLLGLSRIPGENNTDYRARLLDVYTNPANSTYTGLRYGIARELGLSVSDVTISRLSDLMDPSSSESILNSDGNAIGTDLERYADEIYDNNPIFFGNIVSDESYWDGVDETTNGYRYLPHIWDASASGIYDKWQTGGIGDQDDLWVGDPIEMWNPDISDFSWYLPIHTGYFYSANPSGIIS